MCISKDFQASQEHNCGRVSVLIKLQAFLATWLINKPWHRCFPVKSANFLKASPLLSANITKKKPPEVFYKKTLLLKGLQICQGNICTRIIFSIKLKFYLRFRPKCFPVNFVNIFFTQNPRATASDHSWLKFAWFLKSIVFINRGT